MYEFARSFIRRSKTALPFAVLLAVVISGTTAFGDGGGNVMPASARPHGYSLDAMTLKMANFQASGNNPIYYPQTPFQILYIDFAKTPPPSDVACPAPNGGKGPLFTGVNSFTVPSGTPFFVPLFSLDDSPPVLQPFPYQQWLAGHYFFDPTLVGGRDIEVIVDGQTAKLGEAYVGWAKMPPTQPLPNGAHAMVLLGAFLTPMSVGTHTVTIKGQLAGAGMLQYFGINCYAEDYSYRVKVMPGKSGK